MLGQSSKEGEFMKKEMILIFAGILTLTLCQGVFGEEPEKGSMKDSGYDHASMPKVDKAGMQDIMKNYILDKSENNNGIFEIEVPISGKIRKLTFIGLHDDIKMKNGKHYSCADFKDIDTGEALDVDILVDVVDDAVKVTDTAIHKIDGDSVDTDVVEDKGNGH